MDSLIRCYDLGVTLMQRTTAPVLLLLMRCWVAWVFLRSGYLKFTGWDTTLYLFEFEYQVPQLPWLWAAYLGTAAELILPILLVAGLASRLTAALLFGFNAIAVISYPTIWPGGFYDHQLWGLMLLTITLWGPGFLAADSWLRKKLMRAPKTIQPSAA